MSEATANRTVAITLGDSIKYHEAVLAFVAETGVPIEGASP